MGMERGGSWGSRERDGSGDGRNRDREFRVSEVFFDDVG